MNNIMQRRFITNICETRRHPKSKYPLVNEVAEFTSMRYPCVLGTSVHHILTHGSNDLWHINTIHVSVAMWPDSLAKTTNNVALAKVPREGFISFDPLIVGFRKIYNI
jgi:hypothetical protein